MLIIVGFRLLGSWTPDSLHMEASGLTLCIFERLGFRVQGLGFGV